MADDPVPNPVASAASAHPDRTIQVAPYAVRCDKLVTSLLSDAANDDLSPMSVEIKVKSLIQQKN